MSWGRVRRCSTKSLMAKRTQASVPTPPSPAPRSPRSSKHDGAWLPLPPRRCWSTADCIDLDRAAIIGIVLQLIIVANLCRMAYVLPMARRDKLIEKLRRHPRDFTWDELVSLLKSLGYKFIKSGKTTGSRRHFLHPDHGVICLYQPHPGNVLKKYQVDQILEVLEQEGLI